MTLLAHPFKTGMVGRNQLDRRDWQGGKYFHREIQSVALSKGKGWVDYEAENPQKKRWEPKATYVEEAGGLIICAGAYKVSRATLLAVLGADVDARDWNMALLRAALPPSCCVLALLLPSWRERYCPGVFPGSGTSFLRRNFELILVVAVGCILTLFGATLALEKENQDRQESFSQLAEAHTETIADILRDVRDIQLEGLSSFFAKIRTRITQEDFKRYCGYR